MKKLFYCFLICCLPFVGVQGQTSTKVGHMNVELILSVMPKVKQINKDVRAYENNLTKSFKIKQDYYEAKKGEYFEKLDAGGFPSEADKKALETEIIKLEKELISAQDDAEEKLFNKQSTLMAPILEIVQKAIDEVANEGGFDYILNVTSGMNILYGAENLNVTKLVATKLGVTVPDKE